jgi:hypothetical protein
MMLCENQSGAVRQDHGIGLRRFDAVSGHFVL